MYFAENWEKEAYCILDESNYEDPLEYQFTMCKNVQSKIAAKWDFWNKFQTLWRVIKLILLSKALKNLALKLFSSIIKIENVTNKNLSRVVTSSPVVVRCLLELRKVTQECNCKEERRDNNLKMSHFSFSINSDLFSALWHYTFRWAHISKTNFRQNQLIYLSN